MKRCPTCKNIYFDDTLEKFCGIDGTPLVDAIKKCPHCKTEILTTYNFCPACGKPTI